MPSPPLQTFTDNAALPLFLFAVGARRLAYGTLGMLMYISPTIQLGLAVWAYGEPFTPARAAAFGCIWAAIALYLGTRRLRG